MLSLFPQIYISSNNGLLLTLTEDRAAHMGCYERFIAYCQNQVNYIFRFVKNIFCKAYTL